MKKKSTTHKQHTISNEIQQGEGEKGKRGERVGGRQEKHILQTGTELSRRARRQTYEFILYIERYEQQWQHQ